MKFMSVLLVLAFGFFARTVKAVPVSLDLSNSIEDDEEEQALIDDDITTHGLERLSSAATCLVAGIEYTHGQQIYRADQCEFCLCLDGEMFCWWQDCPPEKESPCRDRGPFSACLTNPVQTSSTSARPASASFTKSDVGTLSVLEQATGLTTQQQQQLNLSSTINVVVMETVATNNTDSLAVDSSSSTMMSLETETNNNEEDFSSTENSATSSEIVAANKNCIVMGKEYKIGDKLPHDTGNCIECVCGEGARVSCSPFQCSPVVASDEINDYRPPGPRQPLPDVF